MKHRSTVASSVSIQINPPIGYSFMGDTKAVVEDKPEDKTTDERFLAELYLYLSNIEEQREKVLEMILLVKKRVGCKNCDEKKSPG